MTSNFWTVIDLFCGAGGLSEGMQQAGYCVLAGNDLDDAAGETFELAHPEARFFPDPVHLLKASNLLKATGLSQGELQCLVGGPPCQGYSVYNHQRGMQDERSQLFREYLRLVEELRPAWVVMENVTGITSVENGAVVEAILAGLRNLGYHVEHRTLRAEDYGIPQERRRVVFIGNRLGIPIPWPKKSHGVEGGLLPFVTIRDAIGDLPKIKNGEDNGVTAYGLPPRSDYQRMLRRNSVEVFNHAAPKLGATNLQRLRFIPQGGSWRDIPFNLLPAGMKHAKRSDHTKRYGRTAWNAQSSTILTKCDLHWGAFIHPAQDRCFTVREAARIQSFPDSFRFQGSRTEQYVQVGNAVPPMLGREIGAAIIRASEKHQPLLAATG